MLSTLREVTLSHQVAQQKRNGLTVLEREQKVPQMVSLESNTLILLEEVSGTPPAVHALYGVCAVVIKMFSFPCFEQLRELLLVFIHHFLWLSLSHVLCV